MLKYGWIAQTLCWQPSEMAVVDTIYIEFKDAVSVLASAKEVSLQIMLDSNLRKTLLLSAASYFEYTLSREVAAFTDEVTSGNSLISSLVMSKAITRQYHTWFAWDRTNANQFFSLFGQKFRDYMVTRITADEVLAESVKAFMEIGRERNLLVHSDYASYLINKTPEEIYSLYQKANQFVSIVGAELRACSSAKA
jgi:hypothetical protein